MGTNPKNPQTVFRLSGYAICRFVRQICLTVLQNKVAPGQPPSAAILNSCSAGATPACIFWVCMASRICQVWSHGSCNRGVFSESIASNYRAQSLPLWIRPGLCETSVLRAWSMCAVCSPSDKIKMCEVQDRDLQSWQTTEAIDDCRHVLTYVDMSTCPWGGWRSLFRLQSLVRGLLDSQGRSMEIREITWTFPGQHGRGILRVWPSYDLGHRTTRAEKIHSKLPWSANCPVLDSIQLDCRKFILEIGHCEAWADPECRTLRKSQLKAVLHGFAFWHIIVQFAK